MGEMTCIGKDCIVDGMMRREMHSCSNDDRDNEEVKYTISEQPGHHRVINLAFRDYLATAPTAPVLDRIADNKPDSCWTQGLAKKLPPSPHP